MFAATLPDPSAGAGIIERQLEEEYDAISVPKGKPIPLLKVDVPKEVLHIPDRAAIDVERVVFEGNTVFSSKILQRKIRRYLGRTLSGEEIRALLFTVQNVYVKAGYILAHVYFPQQQLDSGTLTIHILEGTLGRLFIRGNEYYSNKFITGYFKHLFHKPVKYDEIMRALMLANENLDIQLAGVFKKGHWTGEVDLVLRVLDKMPINSYFTFSNHGSDAASRKRFGGQLVAGNCLKEGSVAKIGALGGSPLDELYFYSVEYSLPLNFKGAMLGVSNLGSRFEASQLPDLRLVGKSVIVNVSFLQKLVRSRKFSNDVFAKFSYKNIRNLSDGNTISTDFLRDLEAGVRFDFSDPLKARNQLQVSVVGGIPEILGGSNVVNTGSSRPNAGAYFIKAVTEFQRLQPLPFYSFLIFSLNGQLSANKLTLPEEIYIGGYGIVRGYQVATGIGDHGYYLTAECRFPVPGLTTQRSWINKKKPWKDVLALLVFVDHGFVRLDSTPSAGEKKVTNATSIGFGARVFGPWKLDFSFDWGFRMTRGSPHSIVYFKVSMHPF